MSAPLKLNDIWLERIKASVEGLEYGSVQITIHDGRIVQIERTERKRFEAPSIQGAASGVAKSSPRGR